MNVVITGASKGMGRAMALKFAGAGATLFLCSRKQEQLGLLKTEILKQFPDRHVHVFAADLAVKAQVQDFGTFCLQYGTPDILINNVGTYHPGNLHDEADGAMESIMNLNFYSAYHLTRALLPSMISKKRGYIFNVCSIAALKAYPGGGSYSVSKFAMHGFSQNLRHELMPHGIAVTTIHPGAVNTDTWGGFDNSKARIMEPEDVADLVYAITRLHPQAVVEELVLRPQLGDL
jgi:short-subunit dehydrogenase